MVGAGFRSIESILRESFDTAKDEVVMTAYSMSIVDDRVFGLIENALSRGVRVTVIVNNLLEQPGRVVEELGILARRFPHLHVFSYQGNEERGDLHAKVVVIDRRLAIVGSSNLSFRGLVKNHELAVMVEGAQAGLVASAIDRLLGCPDCKRILP